MGFLYVFSVIILMVGFFVFKKSDEKLNIIKWICIFLAGMYAYNICICMFLGVLHITQHMWLLSLINSLLGAIFIFRAIRKKEFQKYKCTKYDVVGLIILLIIFGVMFYKDLYIFKGDVTHYAFDAAIHYRAAKHYAENMQLFVFTENKTLFNFNIMQTGAYINDGIFMNVVHSIFGLDHIYIYQLFETITMFVGVLAFYGFFVDKINGKKMLVGTILFIALYLYGYPYNSWLYGFSYLSVGIMLIALLLSLVENIYSEDGIKKWFSIMLVGMAAFGLIFSYCLFVPAVFAAICIYSFFTELNKKDEKKYLKFFGKYTLILTGILLLITAAGIAYLFVPSFLIEGQTDLISALQDDGGIYNEKYKNFIAYIPFGIVFVFEVIKRFKNKEIRFLDIFSIVMVGYLAVFYIAMIVGKVAPYYMLKIYFIIWMVIFAVTIDILINDIDKKIFGLDAIFLVYLFGMLAIVGVLKPGKMSQEDIFRIYLVLLLGLFMVLPELIKEIKFPNKKLIIKPLRGKTIKLKDIKVTPFAYSLAIFVFIAGWTVIKSDHIIGENEKHSLMNLVGMYYTEDSEYRKAMDATRSFTKENIEVAEYARENLEDMTADNTVLFTEFYHRTAWAIAVLEYESDTVDYNKDIINTTNQHNIKRALRDKNIKYIIRLDPVDAGRKAEYEDDLKQIEEKDNMEIIFKNDTGYIAKINR